MGDHVHSFGPRGRLMCPCGMVPGEKSEMVCGDVARHMVLVRCSCGLLRQWNRAHGYEAPAPHKSEGNGG